MNLRDLVRLARAPIGSILTGAGGLGDLTRTSALLAGGGVLGGVPDTSALLAGGGVLDGVPDTSDLLSGAGSLDGPPDTSALLAVAGGLADPNMVKVATDTLTKVIPGSGTVVDQVSKPGMDLVNTTVQNMSDPTKLVSGVMNFFMKLIQLFMDPKFIQGVVEVLTQLSPQS